MDLLGTLLKGNNSELLSTLTSKGFSMDQAQAFLPAALGGISKAVESLDLKSLLSMSSSEQGSKVMSALDMGSISAALGGDQNLASTGVQALLPKVMELLKSGSGGLGGLAGGLSKLFG